MKCLRDASSLVVIILFTLVVACMIVLLPMTPTKLVVLGGILVVLVLFSNLRSFDWKRTAVLGSFLWCFCCR